MRIRRDRASEHDADKQESRIVRVDRTSELKERCK